jgi:hypothetical protein
MIQREERLELPGPGVELHLMAGQLLAIGPGQHPPVPGA